MTQDLYDMADNAVETKPEYSTWGQCFMEMYEAVWNKAAGQFERFDASIHQPNDKFIRVEIQIIPIAEMNAKYNAEFKGSVTGYNNKDWASVILPSIKALNTSARALPGQWVKITKKPNGRFYTKKDTGEKKELNDFLFTKLFADEQACIADYLSTRAGDPVTASSAADFPAVEPVAAKPSGPSDDLLLKFAQAIVTSAGKQAPGDVNKITEIVRAQIDTNPMLKGKYTTDSPQIMEMIIAAVS